MDRISEVQKKLIIDMYNLNFFLVTDGESGWLEDGVGFKIKKINIRTIKSMARNDLIKNISRSNNLKRYELSNTSLSLFN